MKVEAKYNNGKPWLTLRPENELDDQIVEGFISSENKCYTAGYGSDQSTKITYFNITTHPRPKPLKQRIKEVFRP